ncbi:hypothetical protein GA0061102_1002287 [Rhizobium miluonense]|uniref:Uncharacterized protein n=1 Tax=Rhizobium miluonense TaxID=411945 RepID=A0A1C3UB93_9HYPH|nr:hypothetical protein GA0061102_1002287 [Rhizobium miluonense]
MFRKVFDARMHPKSATSSGHISLMTMNSAQFIGRSGASGMMSESRQDGLWRGNSVDRSFLVVSTGGRQFARKPAAAMPGRAGLFCRRLNLSPFPQPAATVMKLFNFTGRAQSLHEIHTNKGYATGRRGSPYCFGPRRSLTICKDSSFTITEAIAIFAVDRPERRRQRHGAAHVKAIDL